MMREVDAFRARHAEDAHGEPADGACDAIAVEIERRIVGRLNIGLDIHLHAVDHGEKIVAFEIEAAHGFREMFEAGRRRLAVGQRIDPFAPLGQGRAPLRPRAAIVGDIVHRAAEGIDFEHRVALGARQNPHGGVERAAARACLRGRHGRLSRHAHALFPLIAAEEAPPKRRWPNPSLMPTRVRPRNSGFDRCTFWLRGSRR